MPSHQMPHHDDALGQNPVAVAIDKDKNSQHAVKWAVDHLLLNNPNHIALIHVRNKAAAQGFTMLEQNPDANREQLDAEIQQLFSPYRGFCARKGVCMWFDLFARSDERYVQMREVVIDDVEIARALSEFITNNSVSNLVVGASNRNAITKQVPHLSSSLLKFRNPDVPSTVTKIIPDFCTVYVISKGKAISVRSATRPAPIPQRTPQPNSGYPPHFPPNEHVDLDDAVRTPFTRVPQRAPQSPGPAYLERRSFEKPQDLMKTPARPLSSAKSTPIDIDHHRLPRLSNRDSLSEDFDFQASDFGSEGPEHSNDSPQNSQSLQSANHNVEAEMKRLKLELKQTMDMYSTACKEAISAKQKARELHQWKMEEARKFEEARQAEEAALAIAEMEKAKCKAAIEAAQAAQRIAEMESQKRRNAEQKAKREAEEKMKALDALAHSDIRYRKYSIEEIEAATDYFTDTLKIGEGGYGPVYKASLDHTPVAIKVLRPDASQGRKQFQQEVEVLSCIRHPNMVLLLGACPEYGCLVYEYMDNGSLEDRLFRRGNTPSIPWRLRFKIAAEIATGLLFLHQSKPEPLVHRDLKPANILLDRNYVSKISDVGLARLVPPSVADSVTQYRVTSTAGTFCYIDPEYQQTGMLGVKSDIYSLGILLLQIITAKPPMGLTHHVDRAIEKGTFTDLLDPTVPDWPLEDTLQYAKLALKCSELRRKDRPDLRSVVLPELNRLRNLGCSTNDYGVGFAEPSNTSGSQSSNQSPKTNSQMRARSSTGQNQMFFILFKKRKKTISQLCILGKELDFHTDLLFLFEDAPFRFNFEVILFWVELGGVLNLNTPMAMRSSLMSGIPRVAVGLPNGGRIIQREI
ncbi:hypothetical protein ACLOJK_040604 [Asimina triloba]